MTAVANIGRRPPRSVLWAAVRFAAILGLALALAVVSNAGAAGPLRTGFLDPGAFAGPNADESVVRARTAGATLSRVLLFWNAVETATPADPEDPNDPAYNWASVDGQVVQAVRGGLKPILNITHAPKWARGQAVDLPGTWPSPAKYGQFARAAAQRYSGTFTPSGETEPLPRVRYWEAWNEPNAGSNLAPQRIGVRTASPAHYRKMVNAFAGAVHAVASGNYVVAGTLGPFGHDSRDIQVVPPMEFMSDLLCVSMRAPHNKTCSARTQFDVWAHNPYANGGPTGRRSPGQRLDRRAAGDARVAPGREASGHSCLARSAPFWVTEFSWDTNPPDPKGVPLKLHARWVSEALFRIWKAGVSAVIWFRLQDDPLRLSPYQSGFFTTSGHAKYSLEAFRFPFVAFDEPDGVSIWGRTPFGKPGVVIVERRTGNDWVTAVRLRADRYGIFSARLAAPPTGTTSFRARLASPAELSIPFSLKVPRRARSRRSAAAATSHARARVDRSSAGDCTSIPEASARCSPRHARTPRRQPCSRRSNGARRAGVLDRLCRVGGARGEVEHALGGPAPPEERTPSTG